MVHCLVQHIQRAAKLRTRHRASNRCSELRRVVFQRIAYRHDDIGCASRATAWHIYLRTKTPEAGFLFLGPKCLRRNQGTSRTPSTKERQASKSMQLRVLFRHLWGRSGVLLDFTEHEVDYSRLRTESLGWSKVLYSIMHICL